MPQRLDELLQDCTVKITVPGGWGTGFFVAPGLVLTCDHVVKALEGDARALINWQQRSFAEATVVERRTEVDLALLQCSPLPDVEVPCVYLGEAFQPQDDLYTYGYPDSFPQGTSMTGECEGSAMEKGSELLVFKLAQVRPGLSGAPLLNWRTGRICGMVKFTRDRSIDLGGGAIPSRVILEQFPQLRDQQRQFHQTDLRWYDLVTKPEAGVDFAPYLQALATTYKKWWTHYTLTDTTGKAEQPAPEQPQIFDFGLMVQTVEKEASEREVDPSQEQRKNTERLPVLEGIRKYADDHVLLVGRPGSGKSTALIRLLLEEATQALQQGKGQVPVLIELRYWNVSIEGLIQGFLQRHGLTVNGSTLSTLLGQGQFLLLIDGLNELTSESARTQLSAFRRNHPKVPMIFTTRDLGLGGDLGIEKKLKMQPLTEPQMKAFVRAYIPDQAETMLRQLNDRLREFGQTPLLLWMLCEVFQQSPQRQLPTNLAEVFRAFTTMYEDSSVRKHEVALLKGDVRPLSDRRLWKDALKALAALMMDGETPVDFRVAIHRAEAERELSKLFAKEKFPVRDILDDLLKYHLLQNRTTDQLEFRHQLIQEYYAAEHLLDLLPDLLKDEEKFKRDYLNLLKWTQPTALMLGLIYKEAQALQIIELGLSVDFYLAVNLANVVRKEWHGSLVGLLMKSDLPRIIKNTAIVLTSPTPQNAKLKELFHQEEFRPEENDEHLEILISSLDDSNHEIREYAIRKLSQNHEAESIENLKRAFRKESSSDLRTLIINVLANTEKSAPASLIEEALDDENWLVRLSAAQAVRKLNYKTLAPKLIDMLQDEDYDVRGGVAQSLAEFGEDLEIHAVLTSFSRADEEHSFANDFHKFQIEHRFISEALKGFRNSSLSIRKKALDSLNNIRKKSNLIQSMNGFQVAIEKAPWQWTSLVESLAAIGCQMSIEVVDELLEGLIEDENLQLITVPNIAEKCLLYSSIPALKKIFYSRHVNEHIANALASMKAESILPRLITLWKNSQGKEYYSAISKIQSFFKYYNYAIAHGTISQGPIVSLYVSSAPADETLQTQLVNHLTLLERQGVITSWSSHQILPGDDRTQTIQQQLNTADIILLLISPDAIADDTCYHLEIQRAIERHQSGEARVIPILIRPVDWQGAPFGQLDVLPKNHQPITTWPNQDEAFQEIAAGIREIALELRRNASTTG